MESYLRAKLSKYPLSVMFSIIIFFVTLAVSTDIQTIKYNQSKANLEQNLKMQAKSILDFADVLLESRNEKFFSGQSSEVPQIIQNEIFDKFTEVSEGKVFFKEASDSPTNPKNKADGFESEAIGIFKQNPDLKTLERVVEKEGKEFYMMAKPIRSEQKCMQCHPNWTKPGEVIAIEDVLIDLDDFNQALHSTLIQSVVLWIVNITILLTLIYFLFKKLISDRVNKILKIIFRVEKGNFVIDDLLEGENIEQGSGRNEIDRIFRHLKRMVDGLKPVIDNVITESKEVVFEALYGYSKISDNDRLSNTQKRIVEQSNTNLNHLLNTNAVLGEKLEHLFEKTRESVDGIAVGQQVVSSNLDATEEVGNAMDRTVDQINDMERFAEEISQTLSKITDIANETNLISLNAAIEAARAGEHGRGFAVVAEKIRELADISLENAKEIHNVLQSIHTNVTRVTQSALTTKKKIALLESGAQTLQDNFHQLEKRIDQNNEVLHQFKQSFEEERAALTKITEDLKSVGEGNTKLLENTESVADSVNRITRMSNKLKYLADGFDILFENRQNERKVISPPVRGRLQIGGKKLTGWLYDVSESGLSVIVTEQYRDIPIEEGERGAIHFEQAIEGASSYRFEIRYVKRKRENGTRQFGAMKI